MPLKSIDENALECFKTSCLYFRGYKDIHRNFALKFAREMNVPIALIKCRCLYIGSGNERLLSLLIDWWLAVLERFDETIYLICGFSFQIDFIRVNALLLLHIGKPIELLNMCNCFGRVLNRQLILAEPLPCRLIYSQLFVFAIRDVLIGFIHKTFFFLSKIIIDL